MDSLDVPVSEFEIYLNGADVTDDVSPPQGRSGQFLSMRTFLAPSNPSSCVSTQPSTPCYDLPATLPNSPTLPNPANTPDNENDISNDDVPEQLSHSYGNIVPILVPDKFGTLVDDEKHPTKMTMYFALLTKSLDEVFKKTEPVVRESTPSALQRRRSLTYIHNHEKLLMVDAQITKDQRTQSSNQQISVRLLMPLNELKRHKEVLFKNGVWNLIDKRTRYTIPEIRNVGADTMVKQFLQNEYIPCFATTTVATSCVHKPLVWNGKHVTVNAANILGCVFVKNWPGGAPVVYQYPPPSCVSYDT